MYNFQILLLWVLENIIEKSGSMKRYKLNVQVFLGEKKSKSLYIIGNVWWDDYADNYVTYTYQGDYYYCTCSVWGIYIN